MRTLKANKYWNRANVVTEYDIALLRPDTLAKGKRFETPDDVRVESQRSERTLYKFRKAWMLREQLSDCRERHYDCYGTFCPICARDFRRWFISATLSMIENHQVAANVLTVLLAKSCNIEDLDPITYRDPIRKKLKQAGLASAPVIGGFEMVYRARDREWILHVNLLICGCTDLTLKRLKASFASEEFDRPTNSVLLNDPVEQVSYLLKFGTYHRPYAQTGSKRSPAVPLNASQHFALVNWMSRFNFADMVFLHSVRRQGLRLVVRDPETSG